MNWSRPYFKTSTAAPGWRTRIDSDNRATALRDFQQRWNSEFGRAHKDNSHHS